MGCFEDILELKQANNPERHKRSKGLSELLQNLVKSDLEGQWVTGKQLFAAFKLKGYRSGELFVSYGDTCNSIGSRRSTLLPDAEGGLTRALTGHTGGMVIESRRMGPFRLRQHLGHIPCRVEGCPYVSAQDGYDLNVSVDGGPYKIMHRSQLLSSTRNNSWRIEITINGLCRHHEVKREMTIVLWALKHIKHGRIMEAFKNTDRLLCCLM